MKLVYPNKKYIDQYREAYREFKEHNITTWNFHDPDKVDIVKISYNKRHNINLPERNIPMTYYWLIDGDEFVGEINILHYLNDNYLICGGHIDYGVRYSKWGKGYGTKMLALALKKAKQIGLDKVLITCDADNIASAKVVENNGGKLENIRDIGTPEKPELIKRYWIDLLEK